MANHSKPAFLVLALVAAIFVTTQPAVADRPGLRHTVFMAGRVVESSTEGIHFCIGTSERAQVGQVLDVVRLTRDRRVPKLGVRVHREQVATVRIDAILDEHYARATIIDGQARKRDIVRLSRDSNATQH
jgi:hypothetical protein